ncbi:MAG TPA: alpha/beta fold hydrolase, partial [Acidimicrobiales bacterium]
MRLARVALLAAFAVVAVSCGEPATDIEAIGPSETTAPSEDPGTTTTAKPGATTTTTTDAQGGSLKWQSCGPRVECATLQVPLSHDDPSGDKITLALKRRPTRSSKRIGSLLVNPGGPGVPGTSLVDQASLAFSDDLMQRFDIVSWDPRGTGDSAPVDCVDDLDPYFSSDPTPDDQAEKQVLIDQAAEFAAACAARNKDLLAHISTQDTAKDMDLVRGALGEDVTTYFGFSYGSELGATYATLFPKRVRAMVLDGAADPNAGYEADVRSTVVGLEASLNALLDDCASHKRCAFNNNGQSQKAFDELMDSLDANPLLVEDSRPPVGQGIAYYAVVSALY